MVTDRLYEIARRKLVERWRSKPAVFPDGSIVWPSGSERDAYDADLVRWADDDLDDAALELLHRDCIRATIAWNRFLAGSFVLPTECPGGAPVREVDHVLDVIGRHLKGSGRS